MDGYGGETDTDDVLPINNNEPGSNDAIEGSDSVFLPVDDSSELCANDPDTNLASAHGRSALYLVLLRFFSFFCVA